MRIYQIDPTKDARWPELLKRHPRASVFHSVAWLSALQRTYGYEPVVFTTSPPTDHLTNGLLFCRVHSWLTGRRLVSLPFSDHCEPLCDSSEDLDFMLRYLRACVEHQSWKYLEFRPENGRLGAIVEKNGFRPAANYFLHILDLRPDLDRIFRSLDKNSVQRRIHRAEKAGLTEHIGNCDALLKDFYQLFVMTRGRHHLPPIPYCWFQNLTQFAGQEVQVRVARRGKTPIAAILTLRFKDVLYYKYGCSDASCNRFGAIPWLLWKTVTAAKSNEITAFDMGRTEEHNAGLLVFKNHWVSEPLQLTYWRYPAGVFFNSADSWQLNVAKHLFSSMPAKLRTLTGNLIYRHIG